ncbi:MAG: alpha-ketoacid dehydrogenase subunit beta [Bacteroidales bacterium]|nr:alpha-ketoacid dehydrogenase subunit beta [Bacteroidales bacterium]
MRKISYSEAIAEAQLQEMQRDEKVILMGLVQKDPYGSAFGQTKGISSVIGEDRIFDMPISEQGYVGAALGAAITGMRPVVELQFQDFITIAMDQIVQQAANMRYMFGGQIKIPLVLRAPTGAYLAAAAQHSHMLESWFAHIPGLKVVLPSDAADAKGLLASAIREDNFVLYFEHKKLYDKKMDVPKEPYTIPIGKAAIKRVGKDITIVAWSFMVSKAIEASQILEKQGISCEVIDLRTVSPLDEEAILKSVAKTNRLLVVQEGYWNSSVATSVSALVAEKGFDYLDAPITLITAKEVPIPFAPVLENYVLPQTNNIVETAQKILNKI